MNTRAPGIAARTTTVEEALLTILSAVSRGPTDRVPLAEAGGRVLGEAITAGEDLWPFPRAAMDGIAVRSADVVRATADAPVRLQVVGTVYSGEVWSVALAPGMAIRIATGSPVPPGADAVIPRELLQWDQHDALVTAPVAAGRHVFPAGEDARAGEAVMTPGITLTGGHLGLLAALGHATVPVVRRPIVAVLATGDELVAPSAALRPGQVRESNSYALAAEIAALGAVPRLLPPAPDRLPDLESRVLEGLAADALVVCGGASVGDRDLVHDALARVGVAMRFAGVAMKPGGPAAFGTSGARPVFALPGTPGAARVAFEVLVRPALRTMAGHRHIHRPVMRAQLTEPVAVTPGRRRYLWAVIVIDGRGARAAPLRDQGTATLRSAAEANALIDLPAEARDVPVGARVLTHVLADAMPFSATDHPPAVAIVGARGAGKTTLIERLIPALRQRGLTVAVVKHHGHRADPEPEGADTARFSRAGAVETVLAGPGATIVRPADGSELDLDRVLGVLGRADIVLVEGYGQSALPKVLVHREGVRSDRPAPAGPVAAHVGDRVPAGSPQGGPGVRYFGWDQIDELGRWLADLVTSGSRQPE
ncbi:MAG: molybdopterin-guanine dinucleotide biosynthesis protein B [Armatimonadota bacterium]|nr:molybdopterin-guanine dinucleotide biosynthesis protein B [Armatimonadota bacterium]